MSILSDRHLARIWPIDSGIQPASIDLHMGDSLLIWPEYVRRDPRGDQTGLWKPVPLEDLDGSVWVLRPGWRYLATTAERIRIRPDLAGEITARSSWARDGLSVLQGPAGWLDPGYVGRPTLELSVVGSELVIWPGASVAQLIVHELTEACLTPYGSNGLNSKYRGDSAPTPSRMHQEGAS